MKNLMKLGVLVLLGLLAAGCTNAFHNGTQMTVGSVKVTGLPANPYAPGQQMVFSYNMGSYWVHDKPALLSDTKYIASVAADGSLTYTFNPPLVITTPTLTFLLINAGATQLWGTFQVDKKHSGKKGGDASLENLWSGATSQTILGKVSGDDVTWSYQ